jgi:arabinofuranosyltransferase
MTTPTPPREPPRRAPGAVAPVARILLLGSLLLYLATLVRTAWVCDDAYHDFRVIDNFWHGYGLRWNIADRVQAFTSPLWTFLIGIAYGITHDFFYTVIGICAVFSLATIWLFASRLATSEAAAALGILLMALSKAYTDFSTSGLENALNHLLLATFCIMVFRRQPGLRPLAGLAVLGGLLSLVRLDAVLPIAPFLLVRTQRERSLRAFGVVALGFSPLLVWTIFSVLYFGFPFPNTAYAKLNTGIPRGELVRQGLHYLGSSAALDPLTLIVIGLGLVLGVVFAVEVALAAGILLTLAYTVIIGGDFMSGRFLTGAFFLAIVLLGRLPIRWSPARLACASAAALGLGLLTPRPNLLADYSQAGPYAGIKRSRLAIDPNGVADERLYYYKDTGLLVARYTSPVPMRKVTLGVEEDRRHKRRLEGRLGAVVVGGAGMLAMAAGPSVHYVDPYALAEPFLARLPAMHGWRVGHFARSIPDGYLRTLVSGRNALEDPQLAEYYEKLRLVTRGDLLAPGRFGAIWDLNVGGARHLLDDYFRVHSRMIRVGLEEVSTPFEEGADASGPGTRPFSDFGIEVDLGRLYHPTSIELSIDNEDDYQLQCLRKGQLIWEETVPMNVPESQSLAVHRCSPDPGSTARGCDAFRFFPAGDGEYSLGHLRIEE